MVLLLAHGLFGFWQKAHNDFMPNPFLRQQLLTAALYVSSPDDVKLFENSPDKPAIDAVFRRISEQRGFANQNPAFGGEILPHYNKTFNLICWGALHQSFAAYFESQEVSGEMRLAAMHKAYGRMLAELVPRKWPQLLTLFAANLFAGVSAPTLLVLLFMFWFMRVWDTARDENLFAIMVLLLALANIFLVGITATMSGRYLIYTNTLAAVSVLVLFSAWAGRSTVVAESEVLVSKR